MPSRDENLVRPLVDEIQEKIPCHEIIVYNDKEGRGKGHALREAFKESKGNIICFLDGDGDIPCRMLFRLLPFIEDFDAVVGSKRITHSPIRRKIMTHLTRLWFRFLFGIQVDTQTGIKLFRRSALESLDHWYCNAWLYDVEILCQLKEKSLKLVEVPIECEIKSQLPVKRIFKILGESLWLKFRLLFPRK